MSTPGDCDDCGSFVIRRYRILGTRPRRCFPCTVDHHYQDLLKLDFREPKKARPSRNTRSGRKQHATLSTDEHKKPRQGGTPKMTGFDAMSLNSGTLTWATMGLSFGTWILGQVNAAPAIENVGLTATIVGTLAVAAKTSGECFKAWMAYREAELHTGDLKAELAEVRASQVKRDTIAKTGVCPYTREMEPACFERPSSVILPGPARRPRRATPKRRRPGGAK